MQQLHASKLKVPPHNLEAEQAVLGSMLLDERTVPAVISRISEADFYSPAHKIIFTVAKEIFQTGKTPDTISVLDTLRKKSKLDGIGGASFLAKLTDIIPLSSRIGNYCRIIHEKSQLRRMIQVASGVVADCYLEQDPQSIADDFGRDFFELAAGRSSEGAKSIEDSLSEVFDEIEKRHKKGDGLAGIETMFFDLDRILSGLCRSDLIILAGRPSMGKTAFAMQLTENVARQGHRALVFSLEMSRNQLIERSLARLSGVNLSSIRSGSITDSDWPKLINYRGALQALPVVIDDTAALSITQIRARARMIHSRNTLGLIVVDYMQLCRGEGQNREQQVSEISRGLKALAKELNVPVVALSQLNRGLENRTDKRPMMADLRESGAIEQDADIICFIYRDEVYNKSSENPAKGIAEIIVGKHRNGPTGIVKLCFSGGTVSFQNLVR